MHSSTLSILCFSVPPTLIAFPSAVRDVVKGETLVASCQASADPPPVIQWFRADQQLNDEGQSPGSVSISQSTEDTTTRSQLTVTGFTSEEAGVYSCVAVNALGNDSRSFQVNIVGESVRFHSLIKINLIVYIYLSFFVLDVYILLCPFSVCSEAQHYWYYEKCEWVCGTRAVS